MLTRPARLARLLAPATLALVLAACTGDSADRGLGPACAGQLEAGFSELEAARAAGVSDGVKLTRAASLLSAARVQEGFGEYQNCVIKAREARALIRETR